MPKTPSSIYIGDETSAYLAWHKLEEIYYPKGFTTEYLTLKNLFDTKMADFDDMGQYLNKVKIRDLKPPVF